jgi:tetratricopeptide (TPR) repeat protein
LGQVDAAAASMNKGDALFASLRTVGPLYLAPFLLGRLLTNFELLKQSARNKSPNIGYQKKQAHQSLKQALKISKKHVLYRVWIYRTAGEYFWFAGKHKTALKWQKKAIIEGEDLGALPDLARTYFEVGKCLMEPQSKCKELNGMNSQNYLDKARAMFEEMDLQYDLDELDRLRNRNLIK